MAYRADPDSIGFLVTDIARLFRAEIDRRVGEAGLGLTAGEGRTLSQAARAGLVRQNVLADRMGVEAMTVSAYLDRLEGRGLIKRIPDPSDRRAKLVQLTPDADAVLSQIAPISAELRVEVCSGLQAQDVSRLLEVLKIVRGNLSFARSENAQQERPAA